MAVRNRRGDKMGGGKEEREDKRRFPPPSKEKTEQLDATGLTSPVTPGAFSLLIPRSVFVLSVSRNKQGIEKHQLT